jgi:pimeloyl-ACP methyl ester carboxylesterase
MQSLRLICATCIALLLHGSISAQTRATRTVNVDGQPIRIQTAGTAERAPGAPVIILEAGAGGTIESWNTVFSKIAAIAPVMAYDRRGLGQSPSDGKRPTPDHVANTLHALLANAGISPPYILAGHSWGGALVRMFAAKYPTEIAGLVYLDATDWESREEDFQAAFIAAGGTAAEFQHIRQAPLQIPPGLPPGLRGEFDVVMELFSSKTRLDSVFATLPKPAVPVAVLIGAGKTRNPPPDPTVPANLDRVKYATALQEVQIRHQSAWALGSPDGLVLISGTAGHRVQVDAPELTVQAIQHVLSKSQIRR